MNTLMLIELPADLLKLIAAFLPEREYRLMAATCTKMKKICREMYDTFRLKSIDRIIFTELEEIGYATFFVERGADEKYIKNRLEHFRLNSNNGDLDLRIAGVKRIVIGTHKRLMFHLNIHISPFLESLEVNSNRCKYKKRHDSMVKPICKEKSRLRNASKEVRAWDLDNFTTLYRSHEINNISAYARVKPHIQNISRLIIEHYFDGIDFWRNRLSELLPHFNKLQKIKLYTCTSSMYDTYVNYAKKYYEELRPIVPANIDFIVKTYCIYSEKDPKTCMAKIIASNAGMLIETYDDKTAAKIRQDIKDVNIKSRGLCVIDL